MPRSGWFILVPGSKLTVWEMFSAPNNKQMNVHGMGSFFTSGLRGFLSSLIFLKQNLSA